MGWWENCPFFIVCDLSKENARNGAVCCPRRRVDPPIWQGSTDLWRHLLPRWILPERLLNRNGLPISYQNPFAAYFSPEAFKEKSSPCCTLELLSASVPYTSSLWPFIFQWRSPGGRFPIDPMESCFIQPPNRLLSFFYSEKQTAGSPEC